jgi:hypothetical protein
MMWFKETRGGSVYRGVGDSQGVGFIGVLFFTLTHTVFRIFTSTNVLLEKSVFFENDNHSHF